MLKPVVAQFGGRVSDLVWVTGVVVRDDEGHEGAVLDVFLVTGHVDGVLAGFCRPVAHVT